MLILIRPNKPDGFDKDVKQNRRKIKYSIKNDQEPDFENKWKDYKSIFSQAQRGKCGYCEIQVIGGQYGDVEHYAPKAAAWDLKPDPNTWGVEQPDLSKVKGRDPNKLYDRGYWWLAYDWDNYLLSCEICNQAWKSAIFPVLENPRKKPPKNKPSNKYNNETPLLLNPFDNQNPSEHLKFGNLGEVEARDNSKFGWATINVCGLDRPSLRMARLWTAKRVYRLIQEFLDANTEELKNRALIDIFELGGPEGHHPGMVRVIFENETGFSWSNLEKLINKMT